MDSQDDTSDFTAIFESFNEKSALIEKELDAKLDSVVRHLENLKEKYDDETRSFATMVDAFKKSSDKLFEENDRSRSLVSEIKNLKKKKSSVLDLKEVLQSQLEDANKATEGLSAKKAKLKEAKNLKQTSLKENQYMLMQNQKLTEAYLGLEVRTLRENRTQFLFRKAFPEDSSVTLFVIIRLVDKVYEVLDSEPLLDNFKELEKNLNETNNLTRFILQVRKQLIEEAKQMLKENIHMT